MNTIEGHDTAILSSCFFVGCFSIRAPTDAHFCRCVVGIGCALVSYVAYGQAVPMPKFEVASVKLTSPKVGLIGMFVDPGGKITITNYTLKTLIHEAYGFQELQILGGPKWVGEERFSILAIPPPDSKSSKFIPEIRKLPPPEEELLMLRALLTERFQLVVHEESREAPVFALVVGQGGRN